MHYVILIFAILIIVILQIRSYISTKNKLDLYKTIFPESSKSFIISSKLISNDIIGEDPENIENEYVEVSQLDIQTSNPVLIKIVQAINNYLQKNKGAVSDFHLMKDIVERYCDAEEEEITTQQPIPLYLGLMGTMVGIIVGISTMAFSGGLENDILSYISELMICVALAMGASFVGILCTTLIAWKSKRAISKVEADKNHFYSWIQTELLPILSGDTTNAIYLLQQNLLSFNHTFKNNVEGLDKALSKIGNVSHEQVELIELIRDIDIRKVAQANISVLKELKDCSKDIAVFNSYLQNVSGYLSAVNALNTNINKHLDRTAVIEKMGAFFESEIVQVAAREQYINQVVANIDDTLRKTFEELKDKTKEGVGQLGVNSTEQYEHIVKMLNAQMENFSSALKQQQEEMLDILRERKDELSVYMKDQERFLSDKASEISTMANEVEALMDTKNALCELVAISKENKVALTNLADSFALKSDMPIYKPNQIDEFKSKNKGIISEIIKCGKILCIIIAVIAFGLYIYNFICDKIESASNEYDLQMNNDYIEIINDSEKTAMPDLNDMADSTELDTLFIR